MASQESIKRRHLLPVIVGPLGGLLIAVLHAPVLKHPFLLLRLALVGLIRNIRQQFPALRPDVAWTPAPTRSPRDDSSSATRCPWVDVCAKRSIPTSMRGSFMQRSFRARRPRHDAVDSRYPLVTASNTLRPSAFHSDGPSAAVPSLLQSRVQVHAAQPQVFDLVLDLTLLPLAVLRPPVSFSGDTALAKPGRYRSGNRSLTSLVRRVDSGNSQLLDRCSKSLTRGRRAATVPVLIISRLGYPYPFRYHCMSIPRR